MQHRSNNNVSTPDGGSAALAARPSAIDTILNKKKPIKAGSAQQPPAVDDDGDEDDYEDDDYEEDDYEDDDQA